MVSYGQAQGVVLEDILVTLSMVWALVNNEDFLGASTATCASNG